MNPEIKRLGQRGTRSKLWSMAIAGRLRYWALVLNPNETEDEFVFVGDDGRLLPLTKSPNGRDAPLHLTRHHNHMHNSPKRYEADPTWLADWPAS